MKKPKTRVEKRLRWVGAKADMIKVLKEHLFEDAMKRKMMVDCREACDALERCHGIICKNMFDLQVLFTIRYLNPSNPNYKYKKVEDIAAVL